MTYISNSLYIFINIRDAGTGSTSFTKATVYKYIDGTDSFDQTWYQWVNIGVFTQAAVTTTYGITLNLNILFILIPEMGFLKIRNPYFIYN